MNGKRNYNGKRKHGSYYYILPLKVYSPIKVIKFMRFLKSATIINILINFKVVF